jgi:hypothetical protein
LDIHFIVGISCERAASLAEENVAARHHVLRSLISLHNAHSIFVKKENSQVLSILGAGRYSEEVFIELALHIASTSHCKYLPLQVKGPI